MSIGSMRIIFSEKLIRERTKTGAFITCCKLTKNILLFCVILFAGFSLISCNKGISKTTDLSAPFLGQKPPGDVPELFAPGILSTDANEFNAAFTPDGKQVYFTVATDSGQSIMMIEFENGTWGRRKPVPFSGIYRDVDPFITADGKKLYFSSNRPIEEEAMEDCDFWFVEKLTSGLWSEAKHLEFPATPGKHDFYFTNTNEGSIYYSVFNEDGTGDIFKVKVHKNISQILQYGISTAFNEHDPFIAPDESFLVFSSDRPGGLGSNDLYISFRNEDDTWSAPQNMGSAINSNKYDYCPILSPDEKYLFFSSTRSGNGDVYWVDAQIIEELKPDFKRVIK